jgi:hypothetical protein
MFLPGDVIEQESSDYRNRSDVWLRAGPPPQKSHFGRRSSIEYVLNRIPSIKLSQMACEFAAPGSVLSESAGRLNQYQFCLTVISVTIIAWSDGLRLS